MDGALDEKTVWSSCVSVFVAASVKQCVILVSAVLVKCLCYSRTRVNFRKKKNTQNGRAVASRRRIRKRPVPGGYVGHEGLRTRRNLLQPVVFGGPEVSETHPHGRHNLQNIPGGVPRTGRQSHTGGRTEVYEEQREVEAVLREVQDLRRGLQFRDALASRRHQRLHGGELDASYKDTIFRHRISQEPRRRQRYY